MGSELLSLVYKWYCKYDHIEDLIKEIKQGIKEEWEAETCLLDISKEGFKPIIQCASYSKDSLHCFERKGLKEDFEKAKGREYCSDILEKKKEERPVYRLICSLCDTNNKTPIAILNLTSRDKESLSSVKDNLQHHIALSLQIHRAIEKWNSLYEITNKLTTQVTNLSSLTNEILKTVASALEAEASSLFLICEEDSNYLELVGEYGYTKNEKGLKILIADGERTGLSAYVAKIREPLSLDSEGIRNHLCWSGGKFPPNHLPSKRCSSWLGIPLINTDKNLLGVIKAENKKDEPGFSKEDMAYLQVLGSHIAICLEMADKYKKEVAGKEKAYHYAISHSLKTPLHSFLEAIRQLKKVYSDIDKKCISQSSDQALKGLRDKYSQIFDIIDEDSYKFARVAKNAIYAAKVERKTYQISPQVLEVKEIENMIERVKRIFRTCLRKENIEIKENIKLSQRDRVYMDKEQIEDVLINLVANSVSAIKDRRPREKEKVASIKILVRNEKGKTYFSISDEGKGIEGDIFTSLPSHPESTGLGLYLTKEIIFAHKGEIFLSEPLEKGICIEFWLPKEEKI